MLDELAVRILGEVASVHAYVDTWRASAAFAYQFQSKDVEYELRADVSTVVLPWPTIQRDAVRENDDARLVKSFPIEFPMGQGDLNQPRLRSDFLPLTTYNTSSDNTTDAFWTARVVNVRPGHCSIQLYESTADTQVRWCTRTPDSKL